MKKTTEADMGKPQDALIYLDGSWRKIGDKGKVFYFDRCWLLSGMTPQYVKSEMKRLDEEKIKSKRVTHE